MKTLTIRIPDDLHKESNEVLEQIGLDVPTALRVFLSQVAATRSIPFMLKAREVSWEIVPVDRKTQLEMDAVASLWGQKASRH